MAKQKNNDLCDVCGSPYADGAVCNWDGPPFTKRSIRIICDYCLNSILPITVPLYEGDEAGIAIMGTCANDVLSLKDMVEDGFDDLKRAKKSIRLVGKAMSLTAAAIKVRLATK